MRSSILFSTILLLSLINQCLSIEYLDINQFIMMGKYHQFYAVNTTTGELIKNVDAGKQNYFFQSFLSGNPFTNSFLLLATDQNDQQDVILEYSINDNTFTEINRINDSYSGLANAQMYAYDPVHNFVALPTVDMNEQNLTIYIWDFNTKQITYVSLPYAPMNGNTLYPVGSYDATTGNYYIIYNIDEPKLRLGTYLVVYNMWTRTIVKEPVYFYDFVMQVPQIVYTNDQIYFIDLCLVCNFKIYTADPPTQSTKNIYTVPAKFKQSNNFGSTFGVKGSSIVLFSSVTSEIYTTTVIDLATMQIHTSPSIAMTNTFQYEWISGGF
ncbi:hypothetical protein PPL_09150 [Heterostelium album PN500]|uniref:Uncharacterized protein n=1 Tax=Heterostelium pallidum (strain ATCC 26659 / Pp 5 / PN500) TaxID=670386 RepID=D3BKR8_HETP5|nr:hypothetical protein PPL_09150 [Heterostelium album PN500]EFA78498.1 hypothetical protein PPL_09150 [Heterostelium album PN500]|eukprot:XP_020430622.1 hypothetical protein PPL_09150 [Heterostelium album PN500]